MMETMLQVLPSKIQSPPYDADTGIMIIMFSLSGTFDEELAWLEVGDRAFGDDSWWLENRINEDGKKYMYSVTEYYHQIEVV